MNDHIACQFVVDPPLPSRVLYVGGCDASRVFLRETSEQRSLYMALSYCLGSSPFLKLTTDNLEDLKDGINIDILLLSFRHAIEIARCLDVNYLWIDALCIIQDGLRDWEVQSAKMAEVYKISYLVLATTKLADPQHDCWVSQKTTIANTGPIQASMIYHPPHYRPPLLHCLPLLTRAWAFQERILAPRILHFGPNELSWECFSEDWCECGRQFLKEQTLWVTVTKEKLFTAFNSKMDIPQMGCLWRDCVQEYSRLQLTYEDDRLPAIAGIATSMQTARTGVYLAGLWSDTLVIDMLWYSSRSDYKPLSAPSWSWAFGEGGVSFLSTASNYPVVAEAEVRDFHCVLNGSSSTGKVKSGWIKLQLSIIECKLVIESELSFVPQ